MPLPDKNRRRAISCVLALLLALPLWTLRGEDTLTLTREQILEALRDGSVTIELPVSPAPEDPTEPTPEPEDPTPEEPTDPEPEPDETAPATIASEVHYRSITVHFAQPVEVYRSVTGCPVVRARDGGPVTVTAYEPAWTGTLHGAHLNPRYDHAGQALHAGAHFFAPLHQAVPPFTLAPGDKVLIARTYSEADAASGRDGVTKLTFGIKPVVEDDFPLVVLRDPPPPEFFRPGLAADGHSEILTWSDVRFEWIERVRLAVPSGQDPPDVARLVARLERPWPIFVGAEEKNGNYTTWSTHYFATTDSDYGRTRNVVYGEALLAALLDLPSAEKRALLAVCVQTGIDLASIARTGSPDNPVRFGHARGGLGAGIGLPIYVLGVLTEDEEIVKLVAGNLDLVQEFNQTTTLTSENRASWSGYDSPVAVGDVVWSDRAYPTVANAGNWLSYRWCCTANAWQAWTIFCDAVSAKVPEAGDLRARTGHLELFNYLDTYESEWRRQKRESWQWCFSELMAAVWRAHRDLGPARFVQPSQR